MVVLLARRMMMMMMMTMMNGEGRLYQELMNDPPHGVVPNPIL
jgi:hypothetical protein